jgi:type II secretory pathway pseudopilin PulG
MTRRANSLIEVLVVISILAVVASIVLSAVARAKRSAHDATCTSNLRQSAQALALYCEDSNGELPPSLYSDFSPILNYLGDSRIVQCGLDPTPTGINRQASLRSGKRVSYFSPLTIEPLFMDRIQALDPNHGVFVCLIHGQRTDPSEPVSAVMGYSGLVLRARRDTAVQRDHVGPRCYREAGGGFSMGRSYWDLFTDADVPDDVSNLLSGGAKEVACEQGR